MATHSSVLAWRIPGTGEPDGLLSMGSHRVGHDCSNLAAAAALLFILVYKMTENHKTWFPNCNSLWFSEKSTELSHYYIENGDLWHRCELSINI